MALSIQDIANFTGLPKATIHNWQNKGIIPKEVGDGMEVVKPIIAYLKTKKEKGEDRRAKSETFEELELEIKKAYLAKLLEEERKLRINNDLQEGLLVEAEKVEAVWEPIVVAINSKLSSFPNDVADQLAKVDDPNMIRAILMQRINDIVEDMGSDEFSDGAVEKGNSDREEGT
jgi:phage terminase Nu1 subunit (DNA packaging protein)